MNKKTTFFTVATVEAALENLHSHCDPLQQTESIAVMEAAGRVLAVAPQSASDLPNFVRSTMDGYAVQAADTFSASDALPAYLRQIGVVQMGEEPTISIQSGETAEIHTGAMLPPGADAVVMIERTQKIGGGEIEILAPVAPGENLVQIGEDIAAGEDVLPAGSRIRPQDIGGLLAIGITEVQVRPRVRVGLLSCGDELIPPEETPALGQIRDINAYILGAMLGEQGAVSTHFGIARDTFDDFYEKARAALDASDMLVLSAGSSVSTRDLTRDVITKLGEPGVLQHGLAIKPGKPTILAVCHGKPVIGLPGNPVSAMLVARQIMLPTVQYLLGESLRPKGNIQAQLTQNIASITGREDSVPVRLLPGEGDILLAEPIFGKSNLIYTLVNADGLLHLPLNHGGYRAGELVNIIPF